jgi:hypothetical protein
LFTENNFESETYLKTCNADFLGELLCDVERDIESLNYDLSSQQSEVDRLREAESRFLLFHVLLDTFE